MTQEKLSVYFDYTCPFVYNATVWLRQVEDQSGQKPNIEWKPFVLAQVNNKETKGWKAWEQPPGNNNRGILALRAGMAAKRQGEVLFSDFHLALVKARHEERKDLTDLAVILSTAKSAGLDVGRLQQDMKNPNITQEIADSYAIATERFGVFGTPTFVGNGGSSFFLKMLMPSPDESVELYEDITRLMLRWFNVGEIKRPQPPWPAVLTN